MDGTDWPSLYKLILYLVNLSNHLIHQEASCRVFSGINNLLTSIICWLTEHYCVLCGGRRAQLHLHGLLSLMHINSSSLCISLGMQHMLNVLHLLSK